jgi:hypothetical protein
MLRCRSIASHLDLFEQPATDFFQHPAKIIVLPSAVRQDDIQRVRFATT